MDITQISVLITLIIVLYIIYVLRMMISIDKKMLNIEGNIEHMVNEMIYGEQETVVDEVQLDSILPPKKTELPKTENKLDKEITPDNYFRLKRGKIIRDLDELINVLKNMPKDEFEHHVNENKNDFANWVRHVYEEEHLADKLEIKDNKKDIRKTLEKARKKQ